MFPFAAECADLSLNGVPADVFKKLMKRELDDAIRPLVDWTSPHSDETSG